MSSSVSVGVIQTSLDASTAWSADNGTGNWKDIVKMSKLEELRARREIRKYLSALNGSERKPSIVLLPELSVPLGFERSLRKIANSMESIIIAGLDYSVVSEAPNREVKNEAVVIIPPKIRGTRVSNRTIVKRVGKTYAAPAEERDLKKIDVSVRPSPTVWVFESAELGTFGVAVCYDFLDLDRIALYRNKIQHLFILAYNRDVTSFSHVAEAISRMVYCNVVVCNCGVYGGSLAVSPYRKQFKRTIYRLAGKNLVNSQLVELPVDSLIAQQNATSTESGVWKNLPPGFSSIIDLSNSELNI